MLYIIVFESYEVKGKFFKMEASFRDNRLFQGFDHIGTCSSVTLEHNNEDSLRRLFEEARSGDIIDFNVAQFGKRKVRAEELAMKPKKS